MDKRITTRRFLRFSLFVAAVVLLTGQPASAQITPEQAADMLLTGARKAYNEKQYDFAAAKFRDFLAKFGGHKESPRVRYELALTLLDLPQKNYTEMRDLLGPLAADKTFADRGLALYHLGLAWRGLGMQELMIADAKPGEAAQRQANAKQNFTQAAAQFAEATTALAERTKPPTDVQELPADFEWVARARCDLAEMQLRTGNPKLAQETASIFVKDPVWGRSRYRDLGRYHYGFASVLLKDYPAAEKTLTMLAPFRDPAFGTHARYLLARTFHETGEHAEAALNYQGVLDDHALRSKEAVGLLQSGKYNNDPEEKQRIERLAKGIAPEHVLRASLYNGVLLYEASRFGEAMSRFVEFAKQVPESPLRNEAELRIGFCQVQMKDYPAALKTLAALTTKDPRLADQVHYWLGKAQVGAADPSNAAAYQQAVSAGIGTLQQAAALAQKLGTDPETTRRRGEIMLELADAQQLTKQFPQAAGTYNQIINDKLLADREEEVQQRLISAWHLAGNYGEADKACAVFQQKFPKSTLLPSVLFRFAENNYFRGLAAEKDAGVSAADRTKIYDETIKRFDDVLAKYPDFPQINLARCSLGLTWYRKGDLEKTQVVLNAIPLPDRSGELAFVPYVLADCLMRTTPAGIPDDALAAGQMEEKLKKAVDHLDGFIAGAPKGTHTADALIKVGLCHQRLAALLAQTPERAKHLASARATYERLTTPEFNNHPLQAQAVMERAKCIAQQGDIGGGINELRRFTNDPLKKANVAPMALVQLATMLRSQNQAAEAVKVLAEGRAVHEPALSQDPQRTSWIALLRYHHGVALQESGKLAEARGVLEPVIKQASLPEAAEAALVFGQCLKEEGQQRMMSGVKALAAAKMPPEIIAAEKLREEGAKMVRDAVQHFEGQAELLKAKLPELPVRGRMLYEAAWGYRSLAEPEVEAARQGIIIETVKKLGPQAAKYPPPQVQLVQIPVQPAEKKARDHYAALIAAFPDAPLTIDARFELAEHFAQRNENDPAIKLLVDGLDLEPGPEVTEKIRVCLGAAHAAKGDIKSALSQFDVVAQNPKSALQGQAHYRAGECLMKEKQWTEAAKRLALFRDQQPLQNLPGLTDRALLRLGQAYANLQDWNQSKQAYERLAAAFGNSSWIDEARYGAGWASQQLKQYDPAVSFYGQITGRTATETAAKAQLQIGLCRLEQKRYPEATTALLVVPFTYDYPELSAVALLEAARAFSEGNEPASATRLLQRVIREYPQTQWAEAATERLKKQP